jgi:lipopolysaccharide/colanic/teichoic acid biosynthesis glycosyltransferase
MPRNSAFHSPAARQPEITGDEVVNVSSSIDSIGLGLFTGNPGSDGTRTILSEEAFHKMISLERKRTERSRKPFVLMLLNMAKPITSQESDKTLQEILCRLSVITRETDVTGWYTDHRVGGVMFMDFADNGQASVRDIMISRVREALRHNLKVEQFDQVNISFHVFPEDWGQEVGKRLSDPTLYPDLSDRADANRFLSATKRIMDVAGSVLALLLLSPLFLAIAVAVKVTSKGPVFFRQRRMGQHGKSFVFLKFRSMHVDSDPTIHREYVKQLIAGQARKQTSNGNGDGHFKLTHDPRITLIGSFLRKTSLDELPQLIHVVTGEMSLVGPRPPIPYEVESYDIWHRRRLLEVKPGITGLWQVSGRSRVTFDDMVRLDLRYARTWSLWMDIKILLRTPVAVVLGDGAY